MRIFTYKNTGDFGKHKVVDVDEAQAQTAEQFKTRAALKLTTAISDEEKSVALHEIAKEIDLLTDAQKVAL